jgi:hypothetical protein
MQVDYGMKSISLPASLKIQSPGSLPPTLPALSTHGRGNSLVSRYPMGFSLFIAKCMSPNLHRGDGISLIRIPRHQGISEMQTNQGNPHSIGPIRFLVN